MDLTGDFIDRIKHLVLDSRNMNNRVLEIEGKLYTDTQFIPLKDPEPVALKVDTLTAIKDYLEHNPDGLELATMLVVVDNPNNVRVMSSLIGEFRQRFCYVQAGCPHQAFLFGNYFSVEQFIISLQSQFVPSETIDALLKIVGNITEGAVRTHLDDGVSQTVTARAGI